MGNRGFTLIEVLVTMALMGVAAMGMAQLFVGQNRQMRTIQIKANLDQLRNVVQSASRDPDTILFTALKTDSAAGGALMSPELKACILSTGTNDPILDCPDGWSPAPAVRLFSRDNHEVTGFYTANGVRCGNATVSSSVTCPFKVSATFRPACPVNVALTIAGKCARAQTIQVGWKIEQLTEIPGFPHYNGIQANFVDSTSSAYSVPVSTQNIQATANLATQCPPMVLTAAMLTTASPIPPGQFDAAKYGNLVGQQFPQTVTSVDAYGQQVCGIDQGALDAESLKTEVCKIGVQSAWTGVTGTYIQKTPTTCDLQFAKVFKLGGVAGAAGKTTDNCPAVSDPAYNYLVGSAVLAVSDIYRQVGGQLQHLSGVPYSAAEKAVAVNMYGINPSDAADGKIICNKPNVQSLTWPPNSTAKNPRNGAGNWTFTLGSGFKSGSLSAYVIGGGGGGSGGSWPSSNGTGGGASHQVMANPYYDAAATQTCHVTLGGSGDGGGTGHSGGTGGSSTFYCGSSPNHLISAGGGGNSSPNGQTGESANFAGNPYGGTGNSGSAGQGAGNNCGAGGGGGHHDHSGGSGAIGCGFVSWTEIYNIEWAP